jgi:flagellin
LDFDQFGISITIAAGSNGKWHEGIGLDLASYGFMPSDPWYHTVGPLTAPPVIAVKSEGNPAQFQIGPNAADTISVEFDRVDVSRAGLASLDTSLQKFDVAQTTDAAEQLITGVDDAISAVSSTRGTFGAYKNRLEHVIASNGVAEENTTAAESRIRDADMAQEMVALTQQQILQQAGQAVLAQANQAPSSALALLRR